MSATHRILMVCTGNICRSPLAHGVLQAKIDQLGLQAKLSVDSAGTSDYHQGDAPDTRMQAVAREAGYDLSALRARGLTHDDLSSFDYILGMTSSHIDFMQRHAKPEQMPKIQLLMFYAKGPRHNEPIDDPYSGGRAGFKRNLAQIELATEGLIASLLKKEP